MNCPEDLIDIFKSCKFSLTNEIQTQNEIEQILTDKKIPYKREATIEKGSIIDFCVDSGIGVEVKIKGRAKTIYRQCERYCKSGNIKSLILITNKAMGFPEEIDGVSCYVVNLGKAWL